MMPKIRLLNSATSPVEPFCLACGLNICFPELCIDICWTDTCETYIPPCIHCNPVE